VYENPLNLELRLELKKEGGSLVILSGVLVRRCVGLDWNRADEGPLDRPVRRRRLLSVKSGTVEQSERGYPRAGRDFQGTKTAAGTSQTLVW
jgi:hypothetical protein